MNEKLKKELVPIIALLVFIIVVLILCAVSAGRKGRQEEAVVSTVENAEEIQTSGEQETESGGSSEMDNLTEETVPLIEGEISEIQETIELEEEKDLSVPAETVPAEPQEPAAQGTVSASSIPPSVSANTEPPVKKTNVEMLAEMMDYWSKDNVEAVEDLSGLTHYRKMSASLQGPAYFYYYGDRNADGRPEGTGIAAYGEDQYYYGSWKDGKRSGEGMWLKMFYYSDSDTRSDRAVISHSYSGNWVNNLPNGEGHEQYGIDYKKAEAGSRYFQNVIGNFTDGLYNGSMYIVTIDATGNVQEWKGNAKQGVFETFEGRDTEGRVPICQDQKDADSHMWIKPLDNKDQGIKEVRQQVYR